MKHQKFINDYENDIKEVRDQYYKNIIINSSYYTSMWGSYLYLLAFLVGVFILLVGEFKIMSYIIALIAMVVLNIIIEVSLKALKLDRENEYLKAIRKKGFLSIDDYEKKLKKYIMGPGGYYEYLLGELVKTYNITESVRKIYGINGEEYFIWTNSHQDKINLLNSKLNVRPEVKTIKVSNIRYYRVDVLSKMVILKTDTEELYFNLQAADIFNEMIKMKKLENLITFTPEDYINDFELFMHGLRSKIDAKMAKENGEIAANWSKLILYILLIGALVGAKMFLDSYAFLINFFILFCVFLLNASIKEVVKFKRTKKGTDDDYIHYFNNNQECLNKFSELKYALGISDSFDRVYTLENACYLTWVANGYFHVFLNIVYFNVVYMAISTSDVIYYKVEGNECLLKLKNRTLSFKKDAREVFAKILPNKDYEWLKGYQNI